MRRSLAAAVLVVLAGCGTTMVGRDSCASQVDAGWQELDLVKVEGFAGTISYAKAFGLLTSAKTQQALNNFERCADEAERARAYIVESRKGR